MPGGWVVLVPGEPGGGVFFYEDPAHRWPDTANKKPARNVKPAPNEGPHAITWEPFLHQLPDAPLREGYRARVDAAEVGGVPSRLERRQRARGLSRVGWFVIFATDPGGGAFFYEDPTRAWDPA